MSDIHKPPPDVSITRRHLISMPLAALGLMHQAGAVTAPAPAGMVVAVSGSCTAGRRALKIGAAVQVGDAIDVPANGKLKLRMADASMISVAMSSSMTIANYRVGGARRDVKLLLAQGLLRIVVAPVDGTSTFEVVTAVGIASVQSTDWFIEVRADAAQVGVLAGTVDLTSAATGQSVSIPAHWGTRVEAKRDPVPPRVWATVEFDAFIRRTE